MWFIGVEVEQKTSAPPPKKNPGSAPATTLLYLRLRAVEEIIDVYCLKTECQAAHFIVTLFGTILILITALTGSTSLLQPHAIQNEIRFRLDKTTKGKSQPVRNRRNFSTLTDWLNYA